MQLYALRTSVAKLHARRQAAQFKIKRSLIRIFSQLASQRFYNRKKFKETYFKTTKFAQLCNIKKIDTKDPYDSPIFVNFLKSVRYL